MQNHLRIREFIDLIKVPPAMGGSIKRAGPYKPEVKGLVQSKEE